MTPAHQKIIDMTLWTVHRRTQELVTTCGYPLGKRPEEQTIQGLRASPLGQHLAALAEYAEGYPYAFPQADVRASVNVLGRALFGDPSAGSFRIHPKFHQTAVGKMMHGALSRFFIEQRPGQLMTIAAACQFMNVKRQTVHQWIADGMIPAIYVGSVPHLYRKDVQRFQSRRAQREQRKQHQRAGIVQLSSGVQTIEKGEATDEE